MKLLSSFSNVLLRNLLLVVLFVLPTGKSNKMISHPVENIKSIVSNVVLYDKVIIHYQVTLFRNNLSRSYIIGY